MVARGREGTTERRVLPGRRYGLERRVGERRLELVVPNLPTERRAPADRRGEADRRVGPERRLRTRPRHVVLLVTDHASDAQVTPELLDQGAPGAFSLEHVALGLAPDRLARGGVDAALLDLTVDAGQRLQALTELRQAAPAVPFVVISPTDDAQHALEAIQAGAQEVLPESRLEARSLTRAVRHAIERNRVNAALVDLALVDELTGLYNRRGFALLAAEDHRLARRDDQTLLVMFADVDGLKQLNDTLGHALGDRALQDAARVLRQTFRESDLVARIGGDEFAVLVRNATVESPVIVENRLERAVAELNRRAGRPYELALSVGFARHKAAGLRSVVDLLVEADTALYRKRDRRRRPRGFIR